MWPVSVFLLTLVLFISAPSEALTQLKPIKLGPQYWYIDADQDGFGDYTTKILATSKKVPQGYVLKHASGFDCDDTNPQLNPLSSVAITCGIGGCQNVGSQVCSYRGNLLTSCLPLPQKTEVCGNGIDEDCSGSDLDCQLVDNDADGVSPADGDCNDNDAGIYPNAIQRFNGVDTDCDGSVNLEVGEDVFSILGEVVSTYYDEGVPHAMEFGDVNGDGYDDVIVGIPRMNTIINGDEGIVYVYFGGPGKLGSGEVVGMSGADVTFIGGGGMSLGYDIKVKDLNNDGREDMIIVALGYNSQVCSGACGDGDGSLDVAGSLMIVYGRSTWSPKYSFYNISDYIPGYASEVVDVYDPVSLTNQGMAVVYGYPLDSPMTMGYNLRLGNLGMTGPGPVLVTGHGDARQVDVIQLQAYTGMSFYGDYLQTRIKGGWDAIGAGERAQLIADLNADGFGDLIMADQYDLLGGGLGKVWVVYGHGGFPAELYLNSLSPAGPIEYYKIIGNSGGDALGDAVEVADVDEDGQQDLIFTSVTDSLGVITKSGLVYVLLGADLKNVHAGPHALWASWVNGTIFEASHSNIVTLGGYLIEGDQSPGSGWYAGLSAGSGVILGDVRGDGVPLILTGYPGHDGGGRAYLVDVVPVSGSVLNVAACPRATSNGTKLGIQMSSGGDVNGDGAEDVLVRDYMAEDGKGAIYLMYGGKVN